MCTWNLPFDLHMFRQNYQTFFAGFKICYEVCIENPHHPLPLSSNSFGAEKWSEIILWLFKKTLPEHTITSENALLIVWLSTSVRWSIETNYIRFQSNRTNILVSNSMQVEASATQNHSTKGIQIYISDSKSINNWENIFVCVNPYALAIFIDIYNQPNCLSHTIFISHKI